MEENYCEWGEDKLRLPSYNYSRQWRVAGQTVLAGSFRRDARPDQGTALSSGRQPREKKKREESESFIYIRDILFILADGTGLAPGASSR